MCVMCDVSWRLTVCPCRYSAWVFVWGFILVAIAFVAVQLEHPRELSLFFFYWFIVVVKL